jgi:hypothetical protein
MTGTLTEIENRLWDTADELRANPKIKSSEYSVLGLGLICLRFALRHPTHRSAPGWRRCCDSCSWLSMSGAITR